MTIQKVEFFTIELSKFSYAQLLSLIRLKLYLHLDNFVTFLS